MAEPLSGCTSWATVGQSGRRLTKTKRSQYSTGARNHRETNTGPFFEFFGMGVFISIVVVVAAVIVLFKIAIKVMFVCCADRNHCGAALPDLRRGGGDTTA